VIEWLPPEALNDALHVAWPPLSAFAPQPVIVVPPSLKFTVPVGVPDPGATALTVAVKVIDWPVTEGFADEATVVVVSALFTLCVSVDEVDALKFASLE
jgi:hypothetical protein